MAAYALVLLDLSLPDGHGLTLANSPTRLNGETPIIVLSGRTDGLMKDTLHRMRVAGTFKKNSLDSREFTETIDQMVLN